MERITRAQIQRQLEFINKRSTKQYGLDINSPGDGFTRYQIYEKDTNFGHKGNLGRVSFGISEIYDVLRAIDDYLTHEGIPYKSNS